MNLKKSKLISFNEVLLENFGLWKSSGQFLLPIKLWIKKKTCNMTFFRIVILGNFMEF